MQFTPLTPLHKVVEYFKDDPCYAGAKRALTVDPADIKTVEDATQWVRDIRDLHQIASIQSPNHRRAVEQIQQLATRTVKDKLMIAAQCSNCQAEIRKLWKEHCELFSKYVPAELWEVVRDRVENFWSFK